MGRLPKPRSPVRSNVKLALVVPGSGLVKAQAEKEGLDRVFRDSGFEWREPGCSMCLAMNDDRLEAGEHCASTSNRNFEGRQGAGGRTWRALQWPRPRPLQGISWMSGGGRSHLQSPSLSCPLRDPVLASLHGFTRRVRNGTFERRVMISVPSGVPGTRPFPPG